MEYVDASGTTCSLQIQDYVTLGMGMYDIFFEAPPVGPKEDNALMTRLADNFSTSVNCTIDYSLAYWHAPVDQSTGKPLSDPVE